jgi:hypothetical protein
VTKVIDFDAFRAEQEAEPVELRVNGRTYELPASIPASLALDIIRRNPDGSVVELDSSELATMGDKIFGGKENFSRILEDNSITMAELPELFKLVFATYNSAGASEAPNPATPARTRRKTSSR